MPVMQVRDAVAGVPVSWGTAPAVDDALRDCRWAAHKRPTPRHAPEPGHNGVCRFTVPRVLRASLLSTSTHTSFAW